jgi:hypothetical protein
MMLDPFAPTAEAQAPPETHVVNTLGPQWQGFTPIPWDGSKRLPRVGDPDYRGTQAVFVDRATGEVIGISPTRAVNESQPRQYRTPVDPASLVRETGDPSDPYSAAFVPA